MKKKIKKLINSYLQKYPIKNIKNNILIKIFNKKQKKKN